MNYKNRILPISITNPIFPTRKDSVTDTFDRSWPKSYKNDILVIISLFIRFY
jgi:hypothetical protein